MEKIHGKSPHLVNLKDMKKVMEELWQQENRFFTILDHSNQVEVFYKYHGTILDAFEKKLDDHKKIGSTWLKLANSGTTLVFNYADLPFVNPFDSEWFPEEALDTNHYEDSLFFEPYRKKFEDLTEAIFPKKEFRIIFLFKKNNIPEVLAQKTCVLDVWNDKEYQEQLKKQNINGQESTKEESKTIEQKTKQSKSPGKGNKKGLTVSQAQMISVYSPRLKSKVPSSNNTKPITQIKTDVKNSISNPQTKSTKESSTSKGVSEIKEPASSSSKSITTTKTNQVETKSQANSQNKTKVSKK